MCVGDVDQIVCHNRRRDRDVAPPCHSPYFFAGLNLVGPDVLESVDNDLGMFARRMHGWRAPRGHVMPGRFPHRSAVLQRVGGQERILLHIALENHHVVVNDRRAAASPLCRRRAKEAPVKHAKVLLPDRIAVYIVAIQPLGPKERDHKFSIGACRCIRMGGLGVPLDLGHSAVTQSSPQDIACFSVDAVETPLENSVFGLRFDVSIQTHFQNRLPLAFDSGRDKYSITPYHRAGVGEPRDGSFPANVLAAFQIPCGGSRIALCNASGRGAAKRRPVLCGTESRPGQANGEQDTGHESSDSMITQRC